MRRLKHIQEPRNKDIDFERIVHLVSIIQSYERLVEYLLDLIPSGEDITTQGFDECINDFKVRLIERYELDFKTQAELAKFLRMTPNTLNTRLCRYRQKMEKRNGQV